MYLRLVSALFGGGRTSRAWNCCSSTRSTTRSRWTAARRRTRPERRQTRAHLLPESVAKQRTKSRLATVASMCHAPAKSSRSWQGSSTRLQRHRSPAAQAARLRRTATLQSARPAERVIHHVADFLPVFTVPEGVRHSRKPAFSASLPCYDGNHQRSETSRTQTTRALALREGPRLRAFDVLAQHARAWTEQAFIPFSLVGSIMGRGSITGTGLSHSASQCLFQHLRVCGALAWSPSDTPHAIPKPDPKICLRTPLLVTRPRAAAFGFPSSDEL